MKTGLFTVGAVICTGIVLTGCASTTGSYEFSKNLKEPRPFTTEESYAKGVLKTMPGLSDLAKGSIIDTAIWEDEVGLVEGGFDPEAVGKTLRFGKAVTGPKPEELIRRYGTIPDAFKAKTSSLQAKGSGIEGAVVDSWLYSKNASGFSIDAQGIGFSLVKGLFSQSEDEKFIQAQCDTAKVLKDHRVLYRLTEEERLRFFSKDEAIRQNGISDAQKADFARYMDKRLLELMIPALQSLGFKPVGDVEEKTNDYSILGKRYQTRYSILNLENGAYGCNREKPCSISSTNAYKAEDDSDYSVYSSGYGFEVSSDGRYASKRLGVGKAGMLLVPMLKGLPLKELNLNLLQNSARENPNLSFYVPQYENDSRASPQFVLDQAGEHFFIVPVARQK